MYFGLAQITLPSGILAAWAAIAAAEHRPQMVCQDSLCCGESYGESYGQKRYCTQCNQSATQKSFYRGKGIATVAEKKAASKIAETGNNQLAARIGQTGERNGRGGK
jgi:hypothetical protein